MAPRRSTKRKAKKHAGASDKDRLNRYVDFLVFAIEEYCERDHPNWRVEILIGLLNTSLRILRDHIDSPTVSHITWESPWITWNYPVEWDWEAWKRRGNLGPGFRYT